MGRVTEEQWVVLDKISDIVLNNVEGDIVEIGVGISTYILNQLAVKFNRVHHMCDPSKRKWRWIEKSDFENFTLCKGNSFHFMKTFPDIQIGVIFIDGAHRYDVVTQEIDFFLPKLVYGGIMLLHDTYPPKEDWIDEKWGNQCGNIYKVRQDLEKRDDLQIFTWPYTARNCGLSMIMKKEPDRPYYQK